MSIYGSSRCSSLQSEFDGDMGGERITSLGTPEAPSDACTVEFALKSDEQLKAGVISRDGTPSATMQVDLDLGGHRIINVAEPRTGEDAVNKAYCDKKDGVPRFRFRLGFKVWGDDGRGASFIVSQFNIPNTRGQFGIDPDKLFVTLTAVECIGAFSLWGKKLDQNWLQLEVGMQVLEHSSKKMVINALIEVAPSAPVAGVAPSAPVAAVNVRRM